MGNWWDNKVMTAVESGSGGARPGPGARAPSSTPTSLPTIVTIHWAQLMPHNSLFVERCPVHINITSSVLRVEFFSSSPLPLPLSPPQESINFNQRKWGQKWILERVLWVCMN